MLLQRHPEISEAFKKKCQLMLVDEAQDLSLLQLRIISLLTDNPVLIGDMKQQIYGFNGACQEIVEEFHKLYPTAQTLKLTQSFRCKNAIADYATKLILANKIGGEDYKGVGDGGQVFMHCGLYENGLNLPKLVDNLHAEYVGNRNMFSKEYLFLTRNNISIIPIIEALYQKKLPFRVNKFQRAYDIPVIKDLCEIIKLAQSPANIQNILSLRYLLPEFKGIRNLDEHPLYQACRQTGADIFTINYSYRNVGLAGKVMEALIQVHDNIETATMGQLINIIWPFYEETWLSSTSWMLENKPEYYMLAVDQLLGKTYANFINDEVDKDNIINECERYGRGVRCYTMHASKGLEADVVYILDADQGLLPNVKKLDDMIKKNCEIDAARQIREERSLCYVACTRAKDELHIIYNEQPAALIMGENPYSMYDHIYETYKPMGDDIGAFTNFLERYVPCQN